MARHRRPHPARRPRRLRRPAALSVALAGLALLGAACSSSGPQSANGAGGAGGRNSGSGLTDLPVLRLASALQPFAACDELLGHLKAEATDRVTEYGLAGAGGYYPYPGIVTDALSGRAAEGGLATPSAAAPPTTAAGAFADADAGASLNAEASTGQPAYSGTNTVEAGIDEGDTVKTDGDHLYLVTGGRLQIVATGGGQPALAGELALPGYPTQLVKVGDTLLVTGTPDQDGQLGSGAARSSTRPAFFAERSALWQIDVSDPAAPALQRQLVVDGSVLSIRMTGDIARVVVRTPPPDLGFVTATSPSAADPAIETNKQIIAGSEIDDWLGGYQLLDAGGGQISSGRLADCSEVARPADFHGFTTTSVLSVDLAGGLSEPNASAVLADGQQVYASAQHLYVALGPWQDPRIFATDVATDVDGDPQADAEDTTTSIHRFTFDGDRAAYSASGEVTGSLMNDFSMSEHDGVLRVATTAGSPWMWGSAPSSESYVTTLRAEGAELTPVGQVGGLGQGERIYAVRFIGTNGYVVTFRQTDPLYVVDLADPANPAVTGELKINGYSAYLHGLSDGRLLGVGQDATDEGRVTGAQVSIFDVSDPANPQRTAAYAIPNGWTSAEGDYKAFLYWQPEQLVLLPLSSWQPDGTNFNGSVGLDIGETITERGRITATPVQPDCGPVPVTTLAVPEQTTTDEQAPIAVGEPAPFCPPWSAPFDRNIVVGDVVYSISYGTVQASAIADLSPLGQLALPA
jgi:hypothetical protein